ncbi:MAG: hypothetical protein EA349_03100 [Halomonadaceae bacterium]|nr:MAG: hypothetical protein EA349_03100 [Halomonadaceae bacterium]
MGYDQTMMRIRYPQRPLLPSRATRLMTLLACGVCLLLLALPASADNREAREDWLDIVRQTPYWASQGVAANLATVRRWVLLGDSFCSEPQRHLLFDHRGQFLTYINNGDNSEATVERLNETRQQLVANDRVSDWSPARDSRRGYPFALACNQPFADMGKAIARMTSTEADYGVWGTWDGISVGSEESPASLVALFRAVYEHRRDQGRFSFPASVMPTFMGKTIIESGGQKDALSRQAARGIMQLRPNVLDDCEIPEAFRLHRIAQVDCALRLVEQNHRNLEEPFMAVFSDLPEDKREQLYADLLTQAYQIGVGRVTQLLQDEELGKAARYFAEQAGRFSAQDIQVGMIYHNMGRRDLGLRTLYYVTDARIAQGALCGSPAMTDDPWCDE